MATPISGVPHFPRALPREVLLTFVGLPSHSGSDHYQGGDAPEARDEDAPTPVAALVAVTVTDVSIVALDHHWAVSCKLHVLVSFSDENQARLPSRSYEDRAAAKEQMMQSIRDSSQQDRRVYIGNLSYDVKWHHLKDFMRQGKHRCSLMHTV